MTVYLQKHIYIKPENEYLLKRIKEEAKKQKISESAVVVRALRHFFKIHPDFRGRKNADP